MATTPATARRLAVRISISQVKKSYKLVRMSVRTLTVRGMRNAVKTHSKSKKTRGQADPGDRRLRRRQTPGSCCRRRKNAVKEKSEGKAAALDRSPSRGPAPWPAQAP